jgi:plastocyanin
MRRLSALVSASALVAVLAACTSGGAPGWTYAPAPSITAAPSGGESGAPGASGSPAASGPVASAPASGEPSAVPSSGGSPASSGAANTLTVTAPDGAATAGFQPTSLSASANTPFTIHFDNQDNQAPHNVEVKDANGVAVALGGDTQFFQGPGTRDYQVPALAPGQYTYFCVVHPTTMDGTLTIQ